MLLLGIEINGSVACGALDCDSGDVTSTCTISSHKELSGDLCMDGRDLGSLVVTAGGSIRCAIDNCRVDISMRSIHIEGALEASDVLLKAADIEVAGVLSARAGSAPTLQDASASSLQ